MGHNLAKRKSLSLTNAKAVAERLGQAAWSDNTKRAYQRDWNRFQDWCSQNGESPLPASAELVALFVASEFEAGLKPTTVSRRVSAIRRAHLLAGHPAPAGDILRTTVRGAKREAAQAGVRKEKKPAITRALLFRLLAHLPGTRIGIRDRALLLVGWAGALRRSELAGLNVADMETDEAGVWLHLRVSKTDQEGVGQKVLIPFGADECPVRSLRSWLDDAQIDDGPLFRSLGRSGIVKEAAISPKDVARIVKRAAERAGIENASDYGAHSLRAGLVTELTRRGVSPSQIASITRHQSIEVLHGYYRENQLATHHPLQGVL